MASGRGVVPPLDAAYIYYSKFDSPGIFRAGKSGLNEELVYNPEGTALRLYPLQLFPGGDDLLVVGQRGFSPNARIFRMNLTRHKAEDLGEVSGITSVIGVPDVVWAEPGNSILFSRPVNGLTNIWKYSLQDRSLMQITFGAGPDYSPMPDPLGKGIYYVNGKSSGFLTAYHVHTKESTDIVSEDTTQPAISPDGKRVMYITFPTPQRNEVWASDIDGTNKVKIATGESLNTGGWALDNFHLFFFESEAGTEQKAYIGTADGSGLHQVPPMGAAPIFSETWSADQKSIYVNTKERGEPLFTI